MSTKPFYTHIGGLRGLAIILVILFHLNSRYFPHGFYGVDIFLVISGYLLFLSLSRQEFNLNVKEFATKKLFRIFPPMVVTVLCILVAAMYFQDCEDLIDTSRTGRYTLFCYVNDFLRRTQNDYFASEALENPFLHMWYLSVTIHLYIMFAVGCVIYKYIPKKLTLILLWIAGIASFIYGYSYQLQQILQAVGLPTWNQEMAVSHYRTLPRVWELLAGGAILMLPQTKNKAKATLLTLAALAAVLVPSLSPGALAQYGAPAVVLGTMLIIRYMTASSLMPVLSNKLLMWVGGISFSLYLVHMPVIAFYHIWYQSLTGWMPYVIIVLLSFGLGYLFWFLIEKRRFPIILTLVLWGIGMFICVQGKSTKGFRDYLRPEINNIRITPCDDWKICNPSILSDKLDTDNLKYNEDIFNLANTTLRRPKTKSPLLQMGPESATPSVVLIGDSHAQAAYFGMNRLCHEMNLPGVMMSTTIIPLWDYHIYANSGYFFTEAKAEALLQWLEAHPCLTHVVLAQHWRYRMVSAPFTHWDKKVEPMTPEVYYNALKTFLKRIKELNKQIILIGPGPEIPLRSPTRLIRLATRRNNLDTVDMSPISCTKEHILELNKDILPILDKLQQEGLCTVANVLPYLPEDKPFVSYQNGKFLMFDDDHLSSDGSTEIFRFLRPQLEPLLKSTGNTSANGSN